MDRAGGLILLGLVLGGVALYLGDQAGVIDVESIMTGTTVGFRNGNPGNLRWDGKTKWQGMVGVDKKGFVIFDSDLNGIRALFHDLTTKISVHGLNTLNKIIPVYAPPNENKTIAYIQAVSRDSGIAPNAILSLGDLPRLVPAFIQHENGSQPYSQEFIMQARAAV